LAYDYTILISPIVDLIALAITVAAGYYLFRQKTTAYNNVRILLVIVYVFACALVMFEIFRVALARSSTPPYGDMSFYSDGSTILILVNAWLLSLAAIATYLRPYKSGFRTLFRVLLRQTQHLEFLIIFTLLVILSGTYLVASSPYRIVTIKNLWGDSVYATTFSPFFVLLLGIVLVFYLSYPTPLLLFAARQVKNRAIRRSLIILGACWAAIGLDFFVFDGFLWSISIDANDVMYLIFAGTFSLTAIIFRNASTLAGFFELKSDATIARSAAPSTTISRGLLQELERFEGKSWLMEIDPTVPYEQTIRELAQEAAARRSIVFAFTSRGTPVYKALSGLPNVRFYLLTADVSYTKPSNRPNEDNVVLIPQHDYAIMLQLLGKTVASTEDTGAIIIFDNITDAILSSGLESSYKFLKQAIQQVSEPRVTSVFLFTQDAHDERTENIIKTLFSDHLVEDKSGLRVTKGKPGT
jgi:hypothetical protein